MALQQLSAPLRVGVDPFTHAKGINLGDHIVGAIDPGWTQGATLIDPVVLSPPLTQTWTLLAWGFTFAGALAQPAGAPSYGKLGALWAGLLTEGETSTNGQPWVNPMQPLPPDITTFAKVWDGTVDPVFEQIPSGATGVANTKVAGAASVNLPQPIPVKSGRPIAFGVWLTPSLVANTILQVWNAAYSILYDDGVKEP